MVCRDENLSRIPKNCQKLYFLNIVQSMSSSLHLFLPLIFHRWLNCQKHLKIRDDKNIKTTQHQS